MALKLTCSLFIYLFICLRSHWFVLTPVDSSRVLKEKQISLQVSHQTSTVFLLFHLSCFVFFFTRILHVSAVMADIPSEDSSSLFWEFAAPSTLSSTETFVSAEPLNVSHREKAWDAECCECDRAAKDLIKMGNKQTIFTDEQLDAYQVSLHVSCLPAACCRIMYVQACLSRK